MSRWREWLFSIILAAVAVVAVVAVALPPPLVHLEMRCAKTPPTVLAETPTTRRTIGRNPESSSDLTDLEEDDLHSQPK